MDNGGIMLQNPECSSPLCVGERPRDTMAHKGAASADFGSRVRHDGGTLNQIEADILFYDKQRIGQRQRAPSGTIKM